jgi:hypothetical protein
MQYFRLKNYQNRNIFCTKSTKFGFAKVYIIKKGSRFALAPGVRKAGLQAPRPPLPEGNLKFRRQSARAICLSIRSPAQLQAMDRGSTHAHLYTGG